MAKQTLPEYSKPDLPVPTVKSLEQISQDTLSDLTGYLEQSSLEIQGLQVQGPTLSSIYADGVFLTNRRGINVIGAGAALTDNPSLDAVDLDTSGFGGGGGPPTGPAGGDLSGTYPNPSVVNDSHTHTAATLSGVVKTGDAAGGDLAGTYPNPTLAAIVGAAGPIGSATVVPIVTIDAKGRVTALSSTTITGTAPGGAAGGDLAGTYPNPTIKSSVALTGSPTSAGNFAAQTGVAAQTTIGGAGPSGESGIWFGSGNDTRLYRSAANVVATDDNFLAAAITSQTYVLVDSTDAGGKIYFGSALDTTLYRSAADTLKTDDTFNAVRDVQANGYPLGGQLVEDGSLELAGSNELTIPGTSELWFSNPDYDTRTIVSSRELATVVPNGHYLIAYTEMAETALNEVSLVGDAELIVTDLTSAGGGASPTGAAGGDLSGTYPNPSVVDDSHSHTAATLTGVVKTGDAAGGDLSGTYPNPDVVNDSHTHGIATSITGLAAGVATFLGTPSSANLITAVTDETGSGALVFATSPTLVTPNIGVATGTSFFAKGASSGDIVIRTGRVGDVSGRYNIDTEGQMQWGGADGSFDVVLWRSAANSLRTSDRLLTDFVSGSKDQIQILDTTSGAGLTIGADVNLYRSAANVLKTDDTFSAVGDVYSGSVVAVNQLDLTPSGSAGKLFFGSAWDTNLYRSAASTLNTDGALIVNQYVRGGVAGSGEVVLAYNSNTPAVAAAISFGTPGVWDTNIYRSAANTLKTDDTFNSAVDVQVGGTALGDLVVEDSDFQVEGTAETRLLGTSEMYFANPNYDTETLISGKALSNEVQTSDYQLQYQEAQITALNVLDLQGDGQLVVADLPVPTTTKVPACRAYKSALQTLTTATATAINFDSTRFDNDGIHDNVTNNTRLTCKTSGIYLIVGNISYAPNGTGLRQTTIQLNGGTPIGVQMDNLGTAFGATQMCVTAIYRLFTTDYVELIAYQESGGNLDVQASAPRSPELSMVYLGPAF